jgi:hypothetical protein
MDSLLLCSSFPDCTHLGCPYFFNFFELLYCLSLLPGCYTSFDKRDISGNGLLLLDTFHVQGPQIRTVEAS